MSSSRNPTYVTTEHASDQLAVRTTAPTSVRGAWRRGLTVDIPEAAPIPQHDEARYDARADVVVFRRDSSLTTCYGLSPECLTNIHGVATAAAVDAQFGTSYCSRIDAANLEEVR